MDNITAPGVGAIIATDQIGTTHYPRSKTGFGVEGEYADVSAENPLPVAIVSRGGTGGDGGDASAANQVTEIARLTSIFASVDGIEGLLTALNALVGGTLTVGLPSGAATQATLASLLAKTIAAPATEAKQDAAITALQNSAPADDLFNITPSDTVPLGTIPKALLVTVAGNVAVRGTGASPVTLAVTAGQILPIRARYVYATNTTATVVGLV